jgi:hypothetical protein
MVQCSRCKSVCLDKDNYCNYCGAPLKPEILKMVQDAYEKRRKESIHAVLTALMQSGAINRENLDELMARLESVFGSQQEDSEAESVSE